MCGIAGLIDPRLVGDGAALTSRAKAMADAIAYRGPDGSGVWIEAEAGVALSHRRLAIIDLSPAGAQPMVSADGRWAISYNGEVYNARAMTGAPELSVAPYRGTSDTEVILESVARRGLDATLSELNGMFALALYDRATRTLHLVRDRLGIKPLFYSVAAGRVAFASELKSLPAAGEASGREPSPIDQASVTSFLHVGYVPAPFTIFRDVMKVMPGEVVSISADMRVTRRRYWSLADVAQQGLARPLDVSDDEAADMLHDLLAKAVSDQMISDVPLGAFLSGGIDSSVVAALMVAAGRGPVRTFTIGFPEFDHDESLHAAAVAAHLGTRHETLTVTAADALAVVPKLPEIYDEPFADPSQIPTYLVSGLTRRHVTVALSGDGGDELFAGYERYALTQSLAATVFRVPSALRRGTAAALDAIPDAVVGNAARLLPSSLRPALPADRLKKAVAVLPGNVNAFYLRMVSQCPDPSVFVCDPSEHPLPWSLAGSGELLRRMQLFDTATYLPDDILQKVDRASMAWALEVRPPMLDHRVVELALRLPRRLLVREGRSKWLLRKVLDRYVPRDLIDRPKRGFGVPLADWLRGPLRDWCEDLLDPKRFGGGLLNVDAARSLWEGHISGRRNSHYAIWALLMFEGWRRRWGG